MKTIERLFEDDFLLIVNKPSGLPVHKTVDPLRAHVQGILEKEVGQKLVLFHRLDLGTSGALVLGKDPSINKIMTDCFKEHNLKKIYHCLAEGLWPQNFNGPYESYIKKVAGGKYRSFFKGKDKERAQSHFKLLKQKRNYFLLEVEINTGKTHQIRLHLKDKGYNVVGDYLYGAPRQSLLKGGHFMLHAQKISFPHPIEKGKVVEVEASYPSFWNQGLDEWSSLLENI